MIKLLIGLSGGLLGFAMITLVENAYISDLLLYSLLVGISLSPFIKFTDEMKNGR